MSFLEDMADIINEADRLARMIEPITGDYYCWCETSCYVRSSLKDRFESVQKEANK